MQNFILIDRILFQKINPTPSSSQLSFFFQDLKKGHLWRFLYKQTTTGFVIKKIGDIVDLKRRNLRDRYKLSKKLNKSFFKIDNNHIDALRSINTRKSITNFLHGDLFETKTIS